MEEIDFLSIGYISRTKIIKDGMKNDYIGGPSLNVSKVLASLGYKVGLVSPVGPEITENEIREIEELNIDTKGIWRTDSTFQVIIDNENPPPLVVSISDPIVLERIPRVYTRTNNVYLGPVINELSAETILELYSLIPHPKFFLDVQGYTRRFQGRMMPDKVLRWPNKDRILRYLDVVKLNERELNLVVGEDSENPMEDLGGDLKENGILIVTRGRKGSILYKDGERTDIPPRKSKVIRDATCAGDSYMGSFLSEYCRHGDYIQAGNFASVYSSHIVENIGLVLPKREEILRELNGPMGI